MPSPFFLLETDYKIHPAGAEPSDVTEFQMWTAAGGRGHLLMSWWEKLMLRSQVQRPPSNSSFQPDAKACRGQLWKQAVRPALPVTVIANRGKEVGTSARVSMARKQQQHSAALRKPVYALKNLQVQHLNSILVPLLTTFMRL